MITKEQINRINELAAKARTTEGLTEEEVRERDILRREYVESVKMNVQEKLKQVKFVEDLTQEEREILEKEGKLPRKSS